MEPIIGQNESGGGQSVAEASEATFAKEVLEASQEQPVIVDFWAPWCEPCKQLTPLLEKAVNKAAGAVKLVKVNIDDNPRIAQQLQVQSIPAVFAFYQGRPVDGFMGAQPESEIAAFVSRLAGQAGRSPADDLVAMGQEALKNGDINRAAQAFSQALQHAQDNVDALAGMARCFLETGDTGRARALIEQVPEDARSHSEIESVRAGIELKEQASEAAGQLDELKAKVAADPNDHQARIELADALAATGEKEAAVDALLESVKRDRAWNDEAARKELLKLFEAFGPNDPATLAGRRKLSTILFS